MKNKTKQSEKNLYKKLISSQRPKQLWKKEKQKKKGLQYCFS